MSGKHERGPLMFGVSHHHVKHLPSSSALASFEPHFSHLFCLHLSSLLLSAAAAAAAT